MMTRAPNYLIIKSFQRKINCEVWKILRLCLTNVFKRQISWNFADSTFKNITNRPINNTINDSSNCIDSSNNSTNLNQKFNKIFWILTNIFCNWWKFKVEHKHIVSTCFLNIICGLAVWDQLVDMVPEKSFFKVARNCDQIKHSLLTFWNFVISELS